MYSFFCTPMVPEEILRQFLCMFAFHTIYCLHICNMCIFLFFGTVNANGILRAQTYITHKKHGILVCTDVSYYIIYIYIIYTYIVCVFMVVVHLCE